MLRKKAVDRARPPGRAGALAARLSGVVALMESGRWAEAREALLALDRRWPDRMEVLVPLAQAHSEAGDLPGEREVWQRLSRLFPGDPEVARMLARSGAAAGPAPGAGGGGFEVRGGPGPEHPPEVAAWLREASICLRRGDGEGAERLLNRALAVEPDAPDLLNNLAMAYGLQGLGERAGALLQRISERHPDYLFARTGLARVHLLHGRIAQAEALLQPLLSRKAFHISEFAAFCGAQIDVFLAQGQHQAARTWLGFWESADPGHSLLPRYRKAIGKLGRWQSLRHH